MKSWKLVCVSAVFVQAGAEDVYGWLNSSEDDGFRVVREIGAMVSIDNLLVGSGEFMLFAPTDSAWKKIGIEHLEGADDYFATDLILAASADIPCPKSKKDKWSCVQKTMKTYGVIDSAIGEVYMISPTKPDDLCLAYYYSGGYHMDACASVGEQLVLEDGVVFPIDTVILPDYLMDDLKDMMR
eukprot:Trichotokara_eunicae@DN5567_c0_g1_i11.p1